MALEDNNFSNTCCLGPCVPFSLLFIIAFSAFVLGAFFSHFMTPMTSYHIENYLDNELEKAQKNEAADKQERKDD
ncbi:unnamed protein product [Caenorhabditis auriculariae]|uniref:Uncharacterized protein n=1 Tax=Caenorhabditis auriculariae TaxID=2777116 RepID=A0A8S1GQU3_9PELO|nr:unnamed protein product [Caenorhabditis auriculariae]